MALSWTALADVGFAWVAKQLLPSLLPKLLPAGSVLGVKEFCLDFDGPMYKLTSEGFRLIEVDSGLGLRMESGDCVLARAQLVEFPENAAALISTNSTLARHFVNVCEGSCYVDRGYQGPVTVELRCSGPMSVIIPPSQVVGKFIFLEASRQPLYEGTYGNNILPKKSLHS